MVAEDGDVVAEDEEAGKVKEEDEVVAARRIQGRTILPYSPSPVSI